MELFFRFIGKKEAILAPASLHSIIPAGPGTGGTGADSPNIKALEGFKS